MHNWTKCVMSFTSCIGITWICTASSLSNLSFSCWTDSRRFAALIFDCSRTCTFIFYLKQWLCMTKVSRILTKSRWSTKMTMLYDLHCQLCYNRHPTMSFNGHFPYEWFSSFTEMEQNLWVQVKRLFTAGNGYPSCHWHTLVTISISTALITQRNLL